MRFSSWLPELRAARAEIQAAGWDPDPLGAQGPESKLGKSLAPLPMWPWSRQDGSPRSCGGAFGHDAVWNRSSEWRVALLPLRRP